MVNTRDEKPHDLDESEYHFSDDEMNYEAEPEVTKTAAPAAKDTRQKIIAGLSRYRRMLIGVGVFFILIFIVYKMLQPTSTAPVTEFSDVTTAAKPATPPKPLVPEAAKAAPQPVVAQPPAQMAPPAAPAQPAQLPQQPTAPSMTPPGMQQASSPALVPITVPQQPAAMPAAPPAQTGVATAPPMMQPQTMPILPGSPDVQNKQIMDRLAALDEQNAKVMTLIQTQFAQKIAEYEAENIALKSRMQVLDKRLGNIEASLNKMGQLIQQGGMRAAPTMAAGYRVPPPRPSQPRMVYTVQAIIPGRAWLKSDSGDTVTVAEGDLLKDYGKIIKIDPYDGIVEIDTGNKVIVLSYGSGE